RASLARVAILRAEVARTDDKLDDERRHLETVLTQAPEYGGLIADRLMACCHQLKLSEKGLKLLLAYYQRYPTLDTFNVVFRELRQQKGYEQAWAFAREALHQQPSLLGLDRL